MDERKPVHELSDEELQREIAEASGWRIEKFYPEAAYYHHYRVFHNGMTVCTIEISSPLTDPSIEYVWQRAMKEAPIPDWPNDIGAAIELVRDVRKQLDVHERENGANELWDFGIAISGSFYKRRGAEYKDEGGFLFAMGEDARALSELALLALREIGQGDE